jgi:hypothetical protein
MTSTKNTARIAGAFYVVTIVARIFADGRVRDRFVVSGDATATATNILANQALFRWGFIADIIAFAAYIALAAYLYDVFRPINRNVSLMAAFFGVTSAITQAVSAVFQLAAMAVVGSNAPYLTAFTTPQLHAIALILLRIRTIMYHSAGLVFLGLYCLTLGYLILRSKLMPKAIGVLMLCAGVAYLPFLSPPFAGSLLPNLLIPVGIGQTAFALWMVVAGVKAEAA